MSLESLWVFEAAEGGCIRSCPEPHRAGAGSKPDTAGPKRRQASLAGSHSGFEFNWTGQTHKPALRRRDGGVCLACRKIEHVHDRAADMLLPREHDEPSANGDGLVFNRVGEADVVT